MALFLSLLQGSEAYRTPAATKVQDSPFRVVVKPLFDNFSFFLDFVVMLDMSKLSNRYFK
jgi:hypothetical protein